MATPKSSADEITKSTASPAVNDELVSFVGNALREIVQTTKAANALPQGAARDLYCSYTEFNRAIEEASDRVLGIMSKILKAQGISGNIEKRSKDEQIDMVVECGDDMFERLSLNIDQKEQQGQKQSNQLKVVMVETKLEATPSNATIATAGSWNTKRNKKLPARLLTATNIERPQINFKIPVDNSALTPFIPRLKEKPNSSKPLAILPEYDEADNVYAYLHPYEFELSIFKPNGEQLQRKNPEKTWPNIEMADYSFVDTVPLLQDALKELQQSKEIAVDVEHHSYRSFQGITCLLQMSTRNKDYIFDTLALRDELHVLNLVLTDARIVKILHGATLDIDWLQRDLSLYIVNMFDTFLAAKELNMARLSLAFLLKDIENIDVDKKFQLADWRMRPLPNELINYARQDTRYLIHIYEHLTNRLLDSQHGKRALEMVYKRSVDTCLKRYFKPQIDEESHLEIMRKAKRVFDNQQLYALKEIFKWRDITARLEDESYAYVLPNHMMLHIAEALPREMQGILAICNPIPPPVRQQLLLLHKIVLRAREQPLVKPITPAQNPVRKSVRTWNYHNKLDCPHDLSHTDDIDEGLPTVIDIETGGPGRLQLENEKLLRNPPSSLAMESIAISIYNGNQNSELDQKYWNVRKAELDFITMPFRRYKLMLPQLEKERQQEEERLQNELKKRQLCPTEPSIEQKMNAHMVKHEDGDDSPQVPLKQQLKRPSLNMNQESAKAESQAKRLKTEKIDLTTPTTSKASQAHSGSHRKSATPKHPVFSLKSDDDSEGAPLEITTKKSPTTCADGATTKNQSFSSGRNNRKFKAKARLHAQSSDRPITLPNKSVNNFDYSQVNFKQFKGGAQRAQGIDIKQKVHGKSKPSAAQNKKFNKLFTFSHVKSKK